MADERQQELLADFDAQVAGMKRPRAPASTKFTACVRCMRPHSRTEPCMLPYGLGACTWAQFETDCKICSMTFAVGPPEDRRLGTRICNFQDIGWSCVPCVVSMLEPFSGQHSGQHDGLSLEDALDQLLGNHDVPEEVERAFRRWVLDPKVANARLHTIVACPGASLPTPTH